MTKFLVMSRRYLLMTMGWGAQQKFTGLSEGGVKWLHFT